MATVAGAAAGALTAVDEPVSHEGAGAAAGVDEASHDGVLAVVEAAAGAATGTAATGGAAATAAGAELCAEVFAAAAAAAAALFAAICCARVNRAGGAVLAVGTMDEVAAAGVGVSIAAAVMAGDGSGG